MTKCETILENRRSIRVMNSESIEKKSTSEQIQTENSIINNSRRKNLILKHEILSPECDLFKASTPRRRHFTLMARILGIITLTIFSFFYGIKGRAEVDWMTIFIGLASFASLLSALLMLLKTIEERILFIKGLGIQYSIRNALAHEITNFYPLERIKSFYIFECPDGLKYGHFFAVKLYADSDKADDSNEEMIVLFETMRPPVEFLRRVYKKFDEITNK